MGSSKTIRLRGVSGGALRQRGAIAFIAIALLLIVVAVAIRYLLGASQSTTYGTTAASQSIQALMVAESGLERARGIIKAGVQFGVDKTVCDGFDITPIAPPPELGGGSFTYTPFQSIPSTPPCDNLTCTGCKVGVAGTMGAASRTITSEVAYFAMNGAEGFGHEIKFQQKTKLDDSVVVSNVSFRAKDKGTGGGNAQFTGCTEDPSSGTACAGWAVKGQGTYNVSSSGIYATVATPGVYTLNTTLSDDRYYVAVGAIFPPVSDDIPVSIKGVYASDTGNNKTVGTSNNLDGSTTNTWCTSPSDTLVFGFSSEPKVGGAQTRLTGVTFGTKQLDPLAFLSGSADSLYSEIWYVYVPVSEGGINGLFSTDPNKGTTFSVTGPTPGDDWASGFVCMAGVDKSKIVRLGSVTLHPTVWYEPF